MIELHWIDWTIVFVFVLFLFTVAVVTQKYTTSVSGFLAAERCAGRYLLTMAEGASTLGLIAIIAYWEMYYQAGFCAAWWTYMFAPLGLVLSLSGWVAYRFRETRAMTMAQFFEMRYSRKFRIFGGIMAWISGIIN